MEEEIDKKRMRKLRKFDIAMIAVGVIAIVLAVSFFALKEIERKKRIETEKELRITENKLDGMTQQKVHFEGQWEIEKGRTRLLVEELANEVRRRKYISARLDKTVLQLNKERWRVGDLEQELGEVEGKLSLSIQAKNEIEVKYKGLQTRSTKVVELEKIVVTAKVSQEGKVIVINREEGFIVVDLGSKDDLEIGTVIAIYHDDNLIGRARIEEVREDVAAAAIFHELKWNEIGEDDIVKVF